MSREFSLSHLHEGWAAGIVLLGALFGAMLAGGIADRLGRRTSLFISAMLFVISSVPILFIFSFSLFLIFRFCTGIAAGISSLTVPLYLAEIAPPSKRGAFVASFQFAVTLGTVAAYLVNLIYVESGDWRSMLFFTAVPAAFQAAALFFVPESPKWLFGMGKTTQGAAIQQKLYFEDGFPPGSKGELEHSAWSQLLAPLYRKGIWIGIALVVLQQWCGINAIVYFTPTIFMKAGFFDAKSAMIATLAVGVVNVFMSMLSLSLVDRLGRRTLLLVSQAGVALTLAFFTATFIFPSHPFFSSVTLVAFICAFGFGLGSIPWVLVSEIYPLSIRAHAIACMTFLSWLSNFTVVFTFPHLLGIWGPAWTFALYSIIAFTAVRLFWRVIPETKGKSLEEIELSLYR